MKTYRTNSFNAVDEPSINRNIDQSLLPADAWTGAANEEGSQVAWFTHDEAFVKKANASIEEKVKPDKWAYSEEGKKRMIGYPSVYLSPSRRWELTGWMEVE